MDLSKQVEKLYGQRLRQRVCGICIEGDRILMVHHKGVGPENEFWSAPGGGMEFGSTAAQNLKREFMEETGLEIKVGELLFVHEFLKPPLHAVELFFLVEPIGGSLITGIDPESEKEAQLIQHVSYLSWKEIKAMPLSKLHQIFHYSSCLQDLISMRGYYNFSV